jgi:heme-degrading monooxygenase HmoA
MEMVEPFVEVVIYPTTKDAQTRLASELAGIASEKVRAFPGFPRALVLASEDGATVVAITQWSDRKSFLEFRQSELGRAAVQLAAGLHPQAHWLRQHAAVEAP